MSHTTQSLSDNLFSSEKWSSVLERAYGFNVQRSERGVPYVVFRGAGGPRVVSLPFSDYLPIDDLATTGGLLRELRGDFSEHEIVLKTILPTQTIAALPNVEIAREAVLHVVYPGTKSKSKFKQNIRRAFRDGVQVREVRDLDALDRFYNLFARLRTTKFSSIPQPKSFFAAVHDVFMATGNGYYLEAVYEGYVVASFIILESDSRAYHKFSASSLQELAVRPNNALYGHLFDRLECGDYDAIDLGLTGVSKGYEGLRRFKSATGAEESSITYVRSLPTVYDITGRKRFMDTISVITKQLVEAKLNSDQLSSISGAIYPHFA